QRHLPITRFRSRTWIASTTATFRTASRRSRTRAHRQSIASWLGPSPRAPEATCFVLWIFDRDADPSPRDHATRRVVERLEPTAIGRFFSSAHDVGELDGQRGHAAGPKQRSFPQFLRRLDRTPARLNGVFTSGPELPARPSATPAVAYLAWHAHCT